MAKENLSAKEIAAEKQSVSKKRINLEVDLTNDDDLIVCKVCGHKNSKNSGMCEMCSNYLFID